MFVSFFPSPRAFFWSAAIWSLAAVLAWFFFFKDFGVHIGLPNPAADAAPIIGAARFWSAPFIWFYIYYAAAAVIFASYWKLRDPHEWYPWSVVGSAIIIFSIYFQVEVSVAINAWYGPFYDLLQTAMDPKGRMVAQTEIFNELKTFFGIALLSVIAFVCARFFTSHYIFRWRTAMNNYYSQHWNRLRTVEGASQRVQEDTMRFANIGEGLGKSLIDSVMTLIAFLPVLHGLEKNVDEVFILGAIPYPLVTLSLVWSLVGTGALAALGLRLPGIEFHNQRVEAALRKELVYGEDDALRAKLPTLKGLFENVRQNYFKKFLNYTYFNAGLNAYGLLDAVFPVLMLIPAIVSKKIGWGLFIQTNSAFGQVRDSFQYLVNSWPTIVELISIYKRLRTFESTIHNQPIDPKAEYLAGEARG
jgi:peptide/bleomycin uptake transporter